jgi:hypothetical protein
VSATGSLGHLVHLEIALRRNAEGVCHAVKEGEHRRDVYRLGNLGLTPTVLAQGLYIFRRRAIRRLGHLGDIFEQRTVRIVERRILDVARNQRLDRFLFCSLNPQEVSMRIQSIRTAIQPGDPAGNRFFCPAGEVPFRKMDRIAKAHDLAQKIRAMAKTLENARHLLSPRMGAPFVVYLRHLASGISILNYFNFCLCVGHGCNGQRLT